MKTTLLTATAILFAAAATAAPLAPPQSPVSQPNPAMECNDTEIAIYFEDNAAIVTPEAEAVIDAALTEIALCKIEGVIIEAHTDANGDEIESIDLAEQRAKAVADKLNFNEASEPDVRLVPVGEQFAEFNTGSEKILNRKAVIHLIMDDPIFSVASIDY